MQPGQSDFLMRAGRWLIGVMVLGWLAACAGGPATLTWSADELRVLHSLSLDALKPLSPDPSNVVADNPTAAALGERIYFDTRFSGNGAVSCASCHMPERHFTDGRAFGVGMGTIPLNAMSLVGAAYSPWQTWNGKNDSQWSQALIPLENPLEHGGNRTLYAHLLAEHYRAEYEALFDPLPDLADSSRFPRNAGPVDSPAASAAWDRMEPADRDAVNRVFANLGKVLAAYERTIVPQPARFDRYVASLDADGRPQGEAILSPDEVAGLRIFMGKGQCMNCHNGPRFTNDAFHNTAIPGAPDVPIQRGRIDGVVRVQADPFNCLGAYSDADPDECTALRFMVTESDTLLGGMKTPTLRNVAETGPYMHTGQFATLAEVIQHYNSGGFAIQGHNELTPLALTDEEAAQLEAFLHTLTEEE
ncbi:MAG: cytochrome-c peroxidase [Caldilinea sp.]|nr:cytochrome-c peroxidase [Caldilinea sp.]MCO5209494.1 cytochrome-c peroxidase [Caldilinea sp.]MCW5840455.1 cytochrome-c peroxidase [Caldilinea sp.]